MTRLFATLLLALMFGGLVPSAQAHWLTELVEIAGKSGRVGGELAGELSVGLERSVRLIDKLPAELRKGAVAAEALPDGAWRFRNAAGETITATNADGIRAALGGLGTDGKPLSLYIGEDAAFASRDALAALPPDATLTLALEERAVPLIRSGSGDGAALFAKVSDGVILALKDRDLFGEALWQLQRPLGKSGIRVMSLDSAGPKSLGAIGKRSAEGLPLAETIDPAALASALPSLRGQTIIVTGRIEGDTLAFAGISGSSGTVPVSDLLRVAEQSDVNILLLDAAAAKQPGGTTWLWRERGIAHLDQAMAKASLGDFISALSHGQGQLAIDADWGAGGHFRLSAKPANSEAAATAAKSETAGHSIGEHVSEIALELADKLGGNLVPQSTAASLNSRDTQWDLDNRLIPGIPAWLQYWYLINWAAGLIAFVEVRRWWRFLMRKTIGADVATGRLARSAWETVYWLAFTPLVGWPAIFVYGIRSVIDQVVGLFRLVTSPFRRSRAKA